MIEGFLKIITVYTLVKYFTRLFCIKVLASKFFSFKIVCILDNIKISSLLKLTYYAGLTFYLNIWWFLTWSQLNLDSSSIYKQPLMKSLISGDT